ncbi:VOC family protein [Gluconacetobacter sacchari]|uniref:Ring-cleaving dioxygenase n=2 Tax=Gluconacetobacter sacchari TaxID=92759 RepID=A0A7W4NQR6_9PROT|nr:VOC family protein [Gluconacetobacter sacchari]MBB2162806.1 ring-cleaving dioxygenase [Gluconacetobacter sacchari]GBQ32455.1 dioxygenase [Gluconacetobacter sacchari DSM 12717]
MKGHVTAMSGAARGNVAFYTDVLGQRLVKKTVNFDDPGTYHLYYGDTLGTPGTILTYFPWENAAAGRAGLGEVGETHLGIPEGAFGWWRERLAAHDVAGLEETMSFGAPILRFRDPDGMRFALVETETITDEPWTTSDIPVEVAIRTIVGVRLTLGATEATATILTDVFGYETAGVEGDVTRLVSGASHVDLEQARGGPARLGRGSVHHVAFRAADDTDQARMASVLRERHGIATTEQRDRQYFRSVYFREPGGVLFEIATDAPGFDVDEPRASLGEALKLPPTLERHRVEITRVLPELA